MVAVFLGILSHHKKSRTQKHTFKRSTETVSRHFNHVLDAVLMLHEMLLEKPVRANSQNASKRFQFFENCVGALDGTYIDARVKAIDSARYRNRKVHISTNVLGVCNENMNFIFVLAGWEGSAADSRVLRDAMMREDGLRVSKGTYYLCDNGYANCEGFLAPYRGIRYHLKEWGVGPRAPQNAREYFNMHHASARNVIERAWGLMKMRWAILRSDSFYPIRTQNRIVLACALLHNFIRKEMVVDPFEANIPEAFQNSDFENNNHDEDISGLQNSTA